MKSFANPYRLHAFLVGFVLICAHSATADEPLMHLTFENNESPWIVYGTGTQVGITREPANVQEGQAALQYDYQLKKGVLSGLILPVAAGSLEKLQAIRFAIKTDSIAPVVVVLQEQNGGRYIALFKGDGTQWQQVELAPADFTLAQDDDAPVDANKELNLDQVEGVAIGDFNQIPAQLENDELRALFQIRMGTHTMFIDDFRLSTEPLPPVKLVDGEVSLDKPDRPQLMWIALGEAKVSRAASEAGGGLQLDYKRTNGRIQGLLSRVGYGALKEMKNIAFTVTSTLRTTLAVQIEEPDGGKYYAPVEIPEGGVAQEVRVPFDDFQPANDSRDSNGRLDLDRIHQIVILDASGLLQQGMGKDNILQITNIRATNAP